jgi:hypothetical protein
MTYEWIEIETTPGELQVSDSRMKYRRLLDVNRDGIGYDIVYGFADFEDRSVIHRTYHGILRFKVAFNAGEKINVLIKQASTL